MKKIFFAILAVPSLAFAQTAIGKTAVSNNSVSLEFGSGNRGIILPYVADASSLSNAVPGTVVFDVASKMVKYTTDSGNWFELTKNIQNFTYGGTTIADTTGAVDAAIQNGIADEVAKKAVIGKTTDPAPGVLVLADTNKAMILPKMASPHLNIINPAPGMMAYDTVTNQLAIFNGTVWSFWKQGNP